MVVKEYESAQSFLDQYQELMLMREAVSQLILHNANQNINATASEKCLFGAVLEDDTAILLFCNVAPNNLIIYDASKDNLSAASVALADYINENQITIAGINAKNEICQSFMEQYKKVINCNFVERTEMDIMEVRKLIDIKPIDGKHRLAAPDEAKLITDWLIRFKTEALAIEMDYEAALIQIMKLIEEQKVYVYEKPEGKLVTMAIAIRQLIHGIAINYVYTPEEFRGKGYAAANIYYMCKNYLENGNDFCSLFVDKKNPLSARSYEKIGFQFLEDNYEYAILI